MISASPGAIGGFGANHHLRQSLVFLNVPCMQQPEAYLSGAGSAFDEAGKLSESLKPFLEKFINAYAQWVEQHKSSDSGTAESASRLPRVMGYSSRREKSALPHI